MFQESQHIKFQVSYEDNFESSFSYPSGVFIECDDEPEPSTTMPEENPDVYLILSGDEQNDDAEYFSDSGQEEVN